MVDSTMPVISKFLEDMTDTSLGSDHGITWDTQSLGQHIGGLEANAMNVEGQAIRILLDAGNGLVAVSLVNANSSGSSNAMGVQKDHDFSDDLLGRPGLNHPLFAFGTNAVELSQTVRCLLNDV